VYNTDITNYKDKKMNQTLQKIIAELKQAKEIEISNIGKLKINKQTLFVSLFSMHKILLGKSKKSISDLLSQKNFWTFIVSLQQQNESIELGNSNIPFYVKEQCGMRVIGDSMIDNPLPTEKKTQLVIDNIKEGKVQYRNILQHFNSVINPINKDIWVEIRVALKMINAMNPNIAGIVQRKLESDNLIISPNLNDRLLNGIERLEDAHEKGKNEHRIIQIHKQVNAKIFSSGDLKEAKSKVWKLNFVNSGHYYQRDKMISTIVNAIEQGKAKKWEDIAKILQFSTKKDKS
jgi:hypothetical protein